MYSFNLPDGAGFDGKYQRKVDYKSRMNIPSEFRKSSDSFLLTNNKVAYAMELLSRTEPIQAPELAKLKESRHLCIYPSNIWPELVVSVRETIKEKPGKIRRAFERKIFSNTISETSDPQGRILIPGNLLDYIGSSPGEDVLVLGSGDRLEIWSPELFRGWETSLVDSEDILTA